MKRHLLVICGPTAVGKTELALHLAKKYGGDLLSADSRQVYRGLDIGTGKDLPAAAKRAIITVGNYPHPVTVYRFKTLTIWGFDIVTPDTVFSAADYAVYAQAVIRHIWSQGRLPVITAGTGFYLRALIDPPQTIGAPPDLALRRELSALSVGELQSHLKQLDPHRFQTMNHSDQSNPRRLIRAIEVAHHPAPIDSTSSFKPELLGLIGLTAPNSILHERINRRVLARASSQFSAEVQTLLHHYPDFFSFPSASATGYREWFDYQNGRLTREAAIERWQTRERQYAKRQLTWFKKHNLIDWFDVSIPTWQSLVETKVDTLLH